eukprot:12432218-Alexandrium_andersonii.AAC.1
MQTRRHADTKTRRRADAQTHRHADTKTESHAGAQTRRQTRTQTRRCVDTQRHRHACFGLGVQVRRMAASRRRRRAREPLRRGGRGEVAVGDEYRSIDLKHTPPTVRADEEDEPTGKGNTECGVHAKRCQQAEDLIIRERQAVSERPGDEEARVGTEIELHEEGDEGESELPDDALRRGRQSDFQQGATWPGFPGMMPMSMGQGGGTTPCTCADSAPADSGVGSRHPGHAQTAPQGGEEQVGVAHPDLLPGATWPGDPGVMPISTVPAGGASPRTCADSPTRGGEEHVDERPSAEPDSKQEVWLTEAC